MGDPDAGDANQVAPDEEEENTAAWMMTDEPASLGLLDEDFEGLHAMNINPEDMTQKTQTAAEVTVPDGIDPTKYVLLESFLDSGAARSVCPRTHGDQFGIVPTEASKQNKGFRTP